MVKNSDNKQKSASYKARSAKIYIFLMIMFTLILSINGVFAWSSNNLLSYNDNYTNASDEDIMPIEYLFGQTFTASSDYEMKGIVFKINPENQDVTVSLRLTHDEKPTGSNLVSYTRTFGSSIDYSDVYFPLDYNLVSGTQYAIIIISTNNLGLIEDITSPTYEDGTYIYSTVSMESWHKDYDIDLYFKVMINKSLENLTFTGNQNITRYLQVPQNNILTNGYLNLSGYESTEIVYQSNGYNPTLTGSWTCSVGSVLSCWNSSGYGSYELNPVQDSGEANLYFNYTKPNGTINNVTWIIVPFNQSYGNYELINITIPNSCYTNNIVQFRIASNFPSVGTRYSKWYCNNGSWNLLYTRQASNPYSTELIWRGDEVYWNVSHFNNPSLTIGSTNAWSYSGNFNQTNNKTSNLASIINSYLTVSYLVGTNYIIPFIFHSDTTGILQYLGLDFDNTGFLENSQTYSTSTYETSNSNFILNLTYDSSFYQIINANLYYNGTVYTGTKSTSGINTIFSKNIDLPLISSTTAENKQFYWTVALTNSSGTYYYNSTIKNQTVERINMSDCTATFNITALNISAWGQNSSTIISPFDFKATLVYYLGNGSISRGVLFTNLSVPSKTICIRNNTNYKVTGIIEGSAVGYQTNDYYFNGNIINNTLQNIKLWLLDSTSSTSFIVKVQDASQLPLVGYYVYIYRYVVGVEDPYLVQTIKTDEDGKGVGFFQTETVDYKFIIKDTNGNTVLTTDKRKIVPETAAPYTITFTISGITGNPWQFAENVSDLDYSLTFNQATNVVTLNYADTSSDFELGRLVVYRLNYSSYPNPTVCEQNSTDASSILTCNISSNNTGNYYAIFYLTRNSEEILVQQLPFTIETLSQTIGMIGVLGAFFIILISAFAFAYNEIAGILSVNVAVIFVNILGFVNFGLPFITGMIALSIILLIVLERG